MTTYILNQTELIQMIRQLTGRKWLLKLVMSALCLAVLPGCDKEQIKPLTQPAQQTASNRTTTSPLLFDETQVANINQTMVTVKDASCVLSLWPRKLLRVDDGNGVYLQPYESEIELNPQFEEQYLLTFQYMQPDGRFYEEDAVYCQGVPGDCDTIYPVRVLSVERVADR